MTQKPHRHHSGRLTGPAIVALMMHAAVASAQDAPAASIDTLAASVRIGQEVRVTDRAGREIRGHLERIAGDGLVVKTDRVETLALSDIDHVHARQHDSRKNGTVIGLGAGAAMASAWCIGAVADDSGDIDARVECGEGFTVFPALGALIGFGIDAAIPGRWTVVYQAPAHARGLSLSFRF